MKTTARVSIVFVCMGLIVTRLSLAAFGQSQKTAPKPARTAGGAMPMPHKTLGRPYPYSNEWMHWAWTGSNAPYVAAEREVKAAIAAGETPQVLTKRFGDLARRSPADSLAQFRWAYAAMSLRTLPNHDFVDYDSFHALQGIDPGNVREYARIRFCLTLLDNPNKYNGNIDSVGFRLLKANPDDTYVRQLLIYDLCDQPASRPKSLAMAHTWVDNHPNSPRAHSVLASIYESMFLASNRAADRDMAVHEFQQYLALAPAGDSFRQGATYLIQLLKKTHASA